LGVEALAALAVDGLDEALYRSPLRRRDDLERIPEGIFELLPEMIFKVE
jgi:hypothetical protein